MNEQNDYFVTAPCQTSTFQTGVKSFNKQSLLDVYQEKDSRLIVMSYSKTIVTVMTTSKLIDLPTFISSIGGNLGLFVGFSFINGLFFLYEYADTKMKRKWSHKKVSGLRITTITDTRLIVRL